MLSRYRFEKVKMLLAGFNVVFLTWLLGNLGAVECIQYDLGATCSTDVAQGGLTAEIKFSFNPQIDFTLMDKLRLYVTVNGTQDILDCNNFDQTIQVQCRVTDERYKTEGLVDQSLVLVIPRDDDGTYVLHGSIKESYVPPTTCNFKLFRNEDIKYPIGQNTLSTLLVIPIGLVVIIGIIIDAICTGMRICRCRGRRQSSEFELSDIAMRTSLKEIFVSRPEAHESNLLQV